MKENHELTEAQEDYRRGKTSFHAKRALAAKAIMDAIRKNPGITKDQIFAATGLSSGHGAFDMIRQHRIAYCKGSPAQWFPTNTNPRL